MDELVRVQVGAGFDAPTGWLNFDSSIIARFERLPMAGNLYTKNGTRFPRSLRHGDFVRGLPLESATADILYSSHVIEHLDLESARRALGEAWRILKPGGVWRIVQPDLRTEIERYLEDSDPQASHTLMRRLGVGHEVRRGLVKRVIDAVFSHSIHEWMWDYAALHSELERVGFTSVRSAKYGDSEIDEFSEVERRDRWDGALGVECVKPPGFG